MTEAHSRPPARQLHAEELGVGCELTVLLARTETAAIWLGGFVGYKGGFEFIHFGVSRDPAGLPAHTQGGGPLIGLKLSDGRELIYGGMPPRPGDPKQVRPFLKDMWGFWHASRWVFFWSVRPLPPPGPMTIVCGWPDAGMPETDHLVDAEPILQAARGARPLWG